MLLLWDVVKTQIKRSKYSLRIAVTKILYCIFISNEVAYVYTATIIVAYRLTRCLYAAVSAPLLFRLVVEGGGGAA